MTNLTPQDYKIAWISALPLELAAATTMLDERHPSLRKHPLDDNTYVLGRIGQHNIVIACLPDGEIGTNSAAHVASQTRLTFRSIKYGLMVGVGGGVPSDKHDIRLGDVVVSGPVGQHRGVVQYDFCRMTPSRLHRKGSLNRPPALRTAITTLRSDHLLDEGNKISTYLLPHNSKLSSNFSRPSLDDDKLFNSAYVHVHNSPTCDPNNLIIRRARPGDFNGPAIHYGTIAYGNEVMKDAMIRDQYSKQGVLCFETEAAELMNNFPCVVIRGISDYADSHKNKQWQGTQLPPRQHTRKNFFGL